MPPIVALVVPVANLEVLNITNNRADTYRNVAIFQGPDQVVVILYVVDKRVICPTISAIKASPLSVRFFTFQAMVNRFGVLCYFFLTYFESFRFMPLIVQRSISICVLRSPCSAQFKATIGNIPLGARVVLIAQVKGAIIRTSSSVAPREAWESIRFIFRALYYPYSDHFEKYFITNRATCHTHLISGLTKD